MLHLLLFVVWCLPPSRAKNRLLTRLGHPVDPTATALPNLVWKVKTISMSPGSHIDRANVFKSMNRVELGTNATIGRYNLVSAHPAFARLYPTGATLMLGPESFITGLHHMDCSGSFSLGAFGALAGHQTRVMTHAIDLERNPQAAYPISVGERSFVSARCLLLGGSALPARSVLGAGSVLLGSTDVEKQGLYAGSPARFKRELGGAWFDRQENSTTSIYVPDSDDTVSEAF